jgi:uridine kinase
LAGALPGRVEIVSLDSYYHPLDHLTPDERATRNFDHPDSLDWDLLVSDLRALRSGECIDEPVYRFDLHTRAARSRTVCPDRFVIIEGILALHREDVRGMMDLTVFIETADTECYRRRMDRDTSERGRTAESVEQQYTATVRPMAARYVWPTREHALVVVSGQQPVGQAVIEVLRWLHV